MSKNRRKPVVMHVITGMGMGGAEGMLLKMLSASTLKEVDQVVVSLLPGGSFKPAFADAAADLHELNLLSVLGLPSGLMRLRQIAKELQPDVIQGWMYHGNLGAWMAHRAIKDKAALIWGIRQSLPSLAPENAFARFAIRTGRILSGAPDKVLFNSVKSIEEHTAFGYQPANMAYIPNGFDLEKFAPDPAARHRLRREWGVKEDEIVFAMAARLHPFKNHQGFLRACAEVMSTNARVKVVLAGSGTEQANASLTEMLRATGMDGRVVLLGERSDMPCVMSAIDVKVLPSSHVEGFPNALGEALCTCVPCIATDVGDAKAVVGDGGIVIPRNDHQALVAAMKTMACMPEQERNALGQAGRLRMQSSYGIEAVAHTYLDLYRSLIKRHAVVARPTTKEAS